jgi:hypothetical protein
VVCFAPRGPGEIVGPRRLSGVVVRPLNFTVRSPMHRLIVLLGALLLPASTWGEPPLSTNDARKVEQTLAEWLAHPMEFGQKPKRTKYLTSIATPIAGEPKLVTVHVVEYEMPDGTYGKGFVNPVTWSFTGDLPYDKLTNEQLVMAYSGWVWLFSALNSGAATSESSPQATDAFAKKLKSEGLSDFTISSQYRVGDSEFFEFAGHKSGLSVKGAGSKESCLILGASDPQARLPVVYLYLAKVMRGEL